MSYYSEKYSILRDIFGSADLELHDDYLEVDGRNYPIINDVIVLTEPWQFTPFVKSHLPQGPSKVPASNSTEFAEDIQFTFGEEWKTYAAILPEHKKEFSLYFDLVDLSQLSGKRACDLGCGMGRWSYFLKDYCKELVLVDFSDAIFTARKNLEGSDKCIFFMGDLTVLPFRENFADFLFSLGVLHHLPTPCLDAVRSLRRYGSELLIFLYYALDNRPFYFRVLLAAVTFARGALSKIRSHELRKLFTFAATYGIYMPLIVIGRFLKPLGLAHYVPLYEFYFDKTSQRIEQDVYDRFFTRIEQRVSRKEIMALRDTFSNVIISNGLPYWHFLCKR